MSKRGVLLILLVGWLLVGSITAQDASNLATFQPRESAITFAYPSSWLAREEGRIIALASDQSALSLQVTQPLVSGQFKILLAYLTADQRSQANIAGTDLDSIMDSVIAESNITITSPTYSRYEFNRRLTIRANFASDHNQGSVWLMQMENDAVVLMQVLTAPDEMHLIEGQVIEVLRSIDLSAVMQQLYAIPQLERPLRFNPQQTRLVFNYPEGWTIREPDATTVVLESPQTIISLQFFDYTVLSQQGIPIDDPASILASQQARSDRPDAFHPIQQVVINNQSLPYSTIQGEDFTGISLGRDIKAGFLWVNLITVGDTLSDDLATLAWALLLTTTYRPDPIELTERVLLPRHQFEFFHPAEWLRREVSPSAILLGTSSAMIDATPDSLQFTEDAQLLIQYVSPEEYGVARAGATSASDVLQKFISSASDLTTYDNPRAITLGEFEYAQVDFDNPAYSGTALLSPMTDGGAVWIQLRTPPAQLGDWEPIALAIARSARIVRAGTTPTTALDSAVFGVLGIQPTPIPTPTRLPDAPPDLSDVLDEVAATPAPTIYRDVNFELPALSSTYTTNFSKITASYPAGWVVQESFPVSDISPGFENSIRMSNNPNLLLTNQREIEQGDAEIIVQYTRYDEIGTLGFRGDNLIETVQAVLSLFPQGTFGTPLQFRINGDIMVLVASSSTTRQSLSIHKAVADTGYVTVQLNVNPVELQLWLPTAIAVIQSVQVP